MTGVSTARRLPLPANPGPPNTTERAEPVSAGPTHGVGMGAP